MLEAAHIYYLKDQSLNVNLFCGTEVEPISGICSAAAVSQGGPSAASTSAEPDATAAATSESSSAPTGAGVSASSAQGSPTSTSRG